MIRAREDRWFDSFRRSGDPRGLAKVFDRTASELWRVAAHLCRDRHAAEDAVQGTFLAAIEAQHDWDATRPLLPWLLGLLANRVRENRRRDARVPAAERVVARTGERDPAELAEHGEFGSAFRTALQRLDEPYRSAVERHLVHGVAAPELAAELGVPAGTVRMRLHRGLEQLRQKLPQGFIAGGAVALALPSASRAAMRRVVLARVTGGAAVAAVGSGHVVAGVVGGMLMQKTMLAVVAGAFVLLGLWISWPEAGAAGGEPLAVATVVATSTRPFAAGEVAPPEPAPTLAARREVVPERAPALDGRLRLVLRHGGNQRPVAGLGLQVDAGLPGDPTLRDGGLPPGFPAEPGRIDHGRTDAQGVAVFRLPPGFAEVRPSVLQLDRPLVAQIRSGAETELVVDLPVRIRADVEVVAADGRPLAGARILGRTHDDVGELVERDLGRTGPDGHWREQFLEAGVPVRAVHEGFAASDPADLHGKQPRVTLVLRDGPAALWGTVFGADGRPLGGASVAIQPRVPGVAGLRPLVVVADPQGRYQCAHVPPGPITVFVSHRPDPRGPRIRLARAEAVVAAGERAEVDVRFGEGARVVVTLRDAGGRAVAGQQVGAVLWPEKEVWIHLSAVLVTVETDARGIAVLEGLMPGEYEVQAYMASGVRKQKVVLAEGQEFRCDWSLAAPTFVEVQVVDEARQPLAGWSVDLLPREGTVRAAVADGDGVVRFDDVADEPYEVLVRKQVGVVLSVHSAVANGKRAVLVVPRSAMPEATLRGVVRAAAGIDLADVAAELSLAALRDDGGMRRRLGVQGAGAQDAAPTAAFQFANLPAGAYELAFRRESDREYLSIPRRIDVAGAATLDLGTIELQPPIDVRVDVVCADGGAVTGGFVGAATAGGPRLFGRPRLTADARGYTIHGVPAGALELLVWGADIAPVFVPITVSGAARPVPVTAPRGVPTTFRFLGSVRAQAEPTVVFQQQGVELLRERLRAGAACVRGFPPGSYRIEVLDGDGFRGAADFSVGSTPGGPVEVRLTK